VLRRRAGKSLAMVCRGSANVNDSDMGRSPRASPRTTIWAIWGGRINYILWPIRLGRTTCPALFRAFAVQ